MGFGVGEVLRPAAVARNTPKHGVRESGDAPPALRLGEVDRLGHRRVLGHAAHVQKLVQADPKCVPHTGLNAFETTLHLPVEEVVEAASEPLNAEYQLPAPRAIARGE